MKNYLDEEFLENIPTEVQLEEALQNFVKSVETDLDYQTIIWYILAERPGIEGEDVVNRMNEMVIGTVFRNLWSKGLIEADLDGNYTLGEGVEEAYKKYKKSKNKKG